MILTSKEDIKRSYNNLTEKRRVGNAKGNVWKRARRNVAI